jgi:maltooligosyltrehalose trehalohydrolase
MDQFYPSRPSRNLWVLDFVLPDVSRAAQHNRFGATLRGDLVDFLLWAPRCKAVTLRLHPQGTASDFPMLPFGEGCWGLTIPAAAGDRYQYLVEESALPDPVSRLLPEGVHGATEIVDPSFAWTDSHWHGLPLERYVLYELHVGTFTAEGTLDAAAARLDYLHELGITAVELMPVNGVPGARNWGYDGVGLFAVQSNYGGPKALQRFVDAAHRRGLAVVLDVVYNHLGSEGNYLSRFGPYFTDKHKTPWGDAANYDDEGSGQVRRFVVENALYWLREYHLDGLRLDAVQTIRDDSPRHIVADIADSAHQLAAAEGRSIVVIAETDENQPHYVKPARQGGYGADAVWSDDFHHVIHHLLTGEHLGYYQDFTDRALLPKVLEEPYAFQGEPFQFWQGRPRGALPVGVTLPSQVICLQNHDQVGNRAFGERLTALTPAGARRMAAALLLLAPHTPLIFMGEEYDESAPFQFFSSFEDPVIQKAVSEGRLREFAGFGWSGIPDPQEPATFERSRLQWRQGAENLEMITWYRALLRLRRELVWSLARTAHARWDSPGVLAVQIPALNPRLQIVAVLPEAAMPAVEAGWRTALESTADSYGVRVMLRAETGALSAVERPVGE